MKPYSSDLRIRIFSYSLSHSIRETAKVFQVSPNTVYLLQKLFYETGCLAPHVNFNEKPHLITKEGEMYLSVLLSKEGDLTLAELRDRYQQAYGVRVSIGTLFNTLERLNITRKKRLFPTQRKRATPFRTKRRHTSLNWRKFRRITVGISMKPEVA